MNVTDALTLLTQIVFALLGVISLGDYLRHRDRTRRDIFLMFGSLTANTIIPFFLQLTGLTLPWLTTLASLAALAQPFLLLRLVAYFGPVNVWVKRVSIGGMIFLIAVTLIVGSAAAPPVVSLIAVAYFVIVDGYAMVAFIRGAFTTAGVVRQRLRFVAWGSGLLAGALLVAGLTLAVPAYTEPITAFAIVLVVISGLAYYVGFASPRWLRRAWQLNELRAFMLRTMGKSLVERLSVTENVSHLCQVARRAVGGIAAIAARPDDSGTGWIVQYTDTPALAEIMLDLSGPVVSAWHDRRPVVVGSKKGETADKHRLLVAAGADTLLVVPIESGEYRWGLLLVFLQFGSLFINDDLELLTLLAQQTAVVLENNTLADELRHSNEQLEQKVTDRTAELQRAADELRLLNDVVEQSTQPFALADLNGRLIRFNPAFRSLMGEGGDDLPDLNAVGRTSRDSENHQVERLLAGGQALRYEREYERKDGSVLATESVLDLYRNEAGEPEYLVSFVTDITERKRAEDAIRELNADLERRVTERTAQLNAVNKELEAFSYSVSHDLRSPLRALDGFSQALQEDYADKLDDDANRYLDRIRAASQRMGQLIDDLLQLSRLTRTELKPEPVDLSKLVEQIIADLQEKYSNHTIQFNVQDHIMVQGDPRFLRIALVNLLDNACKYSSKKLDPRVEFGITGQDDKRVYFVRDNGAGFDMAYANKLFGVFQRLHSANEFEGTGIGLATVQRIIHRHGGDIWPESVVDQGTTFYFTLG